MDEYTVQQYMEKFPYLKKMEEYTIFTTKDDTDYLKNSEKIRVNDEEVSIEFIKRILDSDFYYDYAYRYLNNDIASFVVCFIIGGDTAGIISYKRSTLISAMKQLEQSNQIRLSEINKQRLNTLSNMISYDKLKERIDGNKYNINIDGIEYNFNIVDLLSIMQLSEAEFYNICSNTKITEIKGIKKEHIIYAAFKYFNENHILDNYNLPTNIIERYIEIGSLQKIDLQALNKLLETTDKKYQNIELNEELRNTIIKNIPSNLNELETAIYIYIKMCKILTYDEEYYAVNQKGHATLKHQNTDYVSTISLENNKVVCFEFNLIYSKLLSELGIHFSSDYKGLIGEAYGSGHANLQFRSGKYLIKADSVTSILYGDIIQAKLNQPLNGLTCINRNQQSQEEFKEIITRVYSMIATQEKTIEQNPIEHIQTLDELLKEYATTTQNIKDISINERLSILVDKVNSTKMVGIDSLSYILQLRKILFTEEQRNNNVGITIVRNNENLENGRIASASAIFVLNGNSFETTPEQNVYYFYNPNNDIIQITQEELQKKFDEGLFDYVEKDDPRIPGIVEKGELKK